MIRCVAVILTLLAQSLASAARAEEALVLSGGGARGLAHAGVLLGIERRGNDPGIVVGTSMGSIIGALYAAGYDPAAIRAILEREDWRAIFTPFPIEVGPARSVQYPVFRFQSSAGGMFASRAYIPDWRINRRLTHLLFDASARARGDFDHLPRRFRSVTADAETGELIPLGTGDLARAVRASMAAAGFFAPVRWGERYLTDGGIADYLPVAEARHMGGAPVIASDVLMPPKRLTSIDALAVARRSTEILAIHARRESVAPDLLIRPALDPALAPFEYPIDPGPVMDAGLLSTLAAIPDSNRAPVEVRMARDQPLSVSAVSVTDVGLSAKPDFRMAPFLRRSFRPVAPGRYRPDRILQIVDRLYATGVFDGVWPSVEDSTGNGLPVLHVSAESRGPVSLSGALGYDNDRGGRIWASFRRLGALGARPVEVALEGAANGVDQWAAATIRMSSLAFGAAAWTAGAHFSETEIRRQHLPGDPSDMEVRRAGGWLGVETRALDPEIHVAAELRAEGLDTDFGTKGGSYGPWLRVSGIGPLVQVVGTAPAIEGELRFGDVEYRRVRAKGSLATRLGPMAAAIVADAAAVTRGGPLDAAPSMADESLIPALRSGERRGRARAVVGVDLAAPTLFDATIRLRARGGVIADETLAPQRILYSRRSLRMGGARLSSLWWTPFGPVEVGFDANTLGDRRAIVTIGPDF